MRPSFSDVLKEILPFPSVSEETKKKIRTLIEQHGQNPGLFFGEPQDERLVQGDIIEGTTAVYIDAKGETKILNKAGAMILSNSCDIEKQKMLLMAPVYDFKYIAEDLDEGLVESIRQNLLYDQLWFPGVQTYNEFLIDFGRTCPVSGKHITTNYKTKQVKRVVSLSQEGFYFLLTKLTVFLMRPEEDVFRAVVQIN